MSPDFSGMVPLRCLAGFHTRGKSINFGLGIGATLLTFLSAKLGNLSAPLQLARCKGVNSVCASPSWKGQRMAALTRGVIHFCLQASPSQMQIQQRPVPLQATHYLGLITINLRVQMRLSLHNNDIIY